MSMLEVLGHLQALPVLMAVREHEGISKTELVKLFGKGERTIYLRIRELEDEGLLIIDDDNRKHNTHYVFLSDFGGLLADELDLVLNYAEAMMDISWPQRTVKR